MMPDPNHIHSIIMIMDDGCARPGVLVSRGKSGDGAIATSPGVDLPAASAPCRGLRVNNNRMVHMPLAARPPPSSSQESRTR